MLHSEGCEAPAQLPRELWVPHPWRRPELKAAALPMAGGWSFRAFRPLPTQAVLGYLFFFWEAGLKPELIFRFSAAGFRQEASCPQALIATAGRRQR